MARRANLFKASNRGKQMARETRIIVTALVERNGQLLLTQLAKGRFAGFWLLPSAAVDNDTLEETTRRMVCERTGYPVQELHLISVVEESRIERHSLRFVFTARVGEREAGVVDPEITQARWFARQAVQEVLAERDVVPNLGVMSLIQAWLEETPVNPLELLVEDALCPCGSGFKFLGCCGWDAK